MARPRKFKAAGHRQFSLRVAAPVFESLERRAAERAESRNAVAERYIAEGVRMEEHPDVYFRDGALGRRAAIIGTRLDVWQVMDTLRNSGNSVEATAEYLDVSPAKVRAAIRYYAAYRDEVDDFAARATAIADRAEAASRAEQEILAG
jgi:uncharacterized protein (DUF433 family)